MRRQCTRLFFTASLLVLLSFCPAVCRARADELPRGEVVAKVISRSDAAQSYALYLPSNYSPNKKWPIIYAFDPGGRGNIPVELFKDAAEQYGYIVVGSNNSRNGPNVSLQLILQTLWDDTHARFALDEMRVYTSGFSGGARVAFAMAYAQGASVAGVIACSGGFPSQIVPSKSISFIVFSTAGADDFNYPELRRLDATLRGLGIRSRFETFDGGHAWLPKNLCAEALAWMKIQAMKDGREAKNEAFIDVAFKKAVEEAQSYDKTLNAYRAYRAYDALVVEFKGLRDVAEFEQKTAALKTSKEAKDQLKKEKEQEDKQRQLEDRLSALQAKLMVAEEHAEAIADLKEVISDVRKRSEGETDTGERRVARRALQSFIIGSYEQSTILSAKKDYAGAAALLEAAALSSTNNANLLYALACAYAAGGEKKKALAALRNAVEKGFNDIAAIEQSKEFAALRQDAQFREIVDRIQKKK